MKNCGRNILRRDKLKTNKHKRNGKQRIHLAWRKALPRRLRTFYNYVLHSYYFCIYLSRARFGFCSETQECIRNVRERFSLWPRAHITQNLRATAET